jgi:hypothetical protein
VVRIQLPIIAVRDSEPEPDVVIAPLGDIVARIPIARAA